MIPVMLSGKTADLSIGSGWAKPGWTVDIPITLSGGAQATALQWSFGYSTDITKVTVVAGVSTKAAGKTVSCSATTCLIYGGKNTTLADGEVAVTTFQIAAKPSSTTIEITVKNVVAGEPDGGSIPASGGTGKITLPARASVLKFSLRQDDWYPMERRLHERTEVQFETKVTNLKSEKSCFGRTSNISESGISVIQPMQLAADDLVQLEMADSVAVGRVVYSKPEGAEFRIGIVMRQIQLGNSSLSSLLRRTLLDAMPGVPGLEPVETDAG